MLVEGRINQPPSTRSVDSSGAAASVSSTQPDPVQAPAIHQSECVAPSRPSAPRRQPRSSHRQNESETTAAARRFPATTTRSHWRKDTWLPLHRVWHWYRDLICTVLTLLTFIATLCPQSATRTLLSRSSTTTSHHSPARKSPTRIITTIRSSSHSFIAHFILLLLIPLVVMTCSVHCRASDSHSSASQPTHTSQHSAAHHPSQSNNNSTNQQLRQLFEKQFLNIMGLEAQPRLPPNHKVSQYMLDMYHWFRSGLREREYLLEEGGDHSESSDVMNSSRASSPSPNSVIALTSLRTEDLWDIHHRDPIEVWDDEEEARTIEQINNHHRAPTKRRPAQVPRVTLKGPATTIISHKMDNHDDDKANRRIRRSAASPSEESSEAHLTFDLHLPDGDHLKGAELRLYRRSTFERSPPPADTNQQTKQTGSSSQTALSRSHPQWLPYHWSVRYRSGAPLASSSSSAPLPLSTSDNSHVLAHKSSTGEKSAKSAPQFLKRINVYHLLRPIAELHSVPRSASDHHEQLSLFSKLIDTQVIDVRESGWLSFDIFPAIDRWVKHPSENFGLLVTLTDLKGNKVASSEHLDLVVVNQDDLHVQSTNHHQPPEDESAWHEVQPLVITFSSKQAVDARESSKSAPGRVKREHPTTTRTNSKGRRSRGRKHKKANSHRNKCARQLLYFDFQTVGWTDWVVAPPGFQAYFCQGECVYPMESHLNTSNHAIIQSLVNSVNKAVVPTPCCVPTDLSTITLLYHDLNRKVVLTNYHDMVVEGCGCR